MLQALLESIACMQQRSDYCLRIVVVDNDHAASARSVVDGFSSQSQIPVTYAVEPRTGVSQARNRALELCQGEYLAFVDDDEVVEPGWLNALVDTARLYMADVVFGPVLSVLPPQTPPWIRKAKLFDRPRFPTGTVRQTGGAGNVLIARAFLHKIGRGFDAAFGLTGAEDTEFFSHIARVGGRQVWCDEAVAWETVTADRVTLRWLVRRNFMNGMLHGRIHLPTLSATKRLQTMAGCLCGLVVLGLATPLALFAGRHVAARSLMKLARCLGRLFSFHDNFRTNKVGT